MAGDQPVVAVDDGDHVVGAGPAARERPKNVLHRIAPPLVLNDVEAVVARRGGDGVPVRGVALAIAVHPGPPFGERLHPQRLDAADDLPLAEAAVDDDVEHSAEKTAVLPPA